MTENPFSVCDCQLAKVYVNRIFAFGVTTHLTTSHKVVGEHAVGDPFLRAIDDVMLSIFCLLCRRPYASDV